MTVTTANRHGDRAPNVGRIGALTCGPGQHKAEPAIDSGPQQRNRSIQRLAMLAAAIVTLSSQSGQAAETATLLAPVAGACISSPFGPRVMPGRWKAGTFHPGIDLPAPLGAAVRAVAPGTIIRVQKRGPGGMEMLVQHAGFIGVYSHLGLIDPVILGGKRTVAAGEKLAVIGRSGLTYGPHLYFGILINGRPVDPAPYLGLAPCDKPAAAKTSG